MSPLAEHDDHSGRYAASLTRLPANGDSGFTRHAELNWHVLAGTAGLSVLFGLAPAMFLRPDM